MDNKPHVLVVGAGELGRALGGYLRAGNEVSFWDADPEKMQGEKPEPLQGAVPAADLILLCVPSWVMRSVLSDVSTALRRETVVVSLSKGIDPDSGQVMGELLPRSLPKDQPFVIVGGPMLAAEIVAGKNAAAVFASPDEVVARKVADIFRSPIFEVGVSPDPVGVSLAGVLKNIYAIALGIADGLALDGNEKGFISARAVSEMLGIAKSLGMDEDVILGAAGLADFVATAYSPYSRNRAVGDEIVKKGKCDLKGEGVSSLPPLMARLGDRAAQFPLLNLIKTIAVDCKPAQEAMAAYFSGS